MSHLIFAVETDLSPEMLGILKFCLLALMYLFFWRVLRAVWVETAPRISVERGSGLQPAPRPATKAPRRAIATMLRVTAPPEMQGRTFPIATEMTLGRAGGCQVAIPEDSFASQVHARLFLIDDQIWVEDLGSTNGTFVNRARVSAPTELRRGDSLQVGNTVMELA